MGVPAWSRRRWLTASLAVAGCAPLAPRLAVAQVEGRSFQVPQGVVAELLAKQFPKRLEFMQFFQVLLSNPRIQMLPEQNRLLTALDGRMASMLDQRAISLRALEISYGLRFDRAIRGIRLVMPRLERFEIPAGLSAAHAESVRSLGSLLATNALHDAVAHRFTEQEMMLAETLGLTPGAITVEATGLRVELVSAR